LSPRTEITGSWVGPESLTDWARSTAGLPIKSSL